MHILSLVCSRIPSLHAHTHVRTHPLSACSHTCTHARTHAYVKVLADVLDGMAWSGFRLGPVAAQLTARVVTTRLPIGTAEVVKFLNKVRACPSLEHAARYCKRAHINDTVYCLNGLICDDKCAREQGLTPVKLAQLIKTIRVP